MEAAEWMKDTVVYHEIFEMGVAVGRVRGARDSLSRIAIKMWGEPEPEIRAKLDSMTDLAELNDLRDRLIDGAFTSWAELLRV